MRQAARARATVAALGVLVALGPGRARGDSVVNGLPDRVRQEVRQEILGQNTPNFADAFDYGNLARGFMIYILGKPFLFSEEDIDAIVGDPWHMNDATRVKLDALPPRLRLKLYSVLAGRSDRIYLLGLNRLGQVGVGEGRPVGIYMDDDTRQKALDGIGKAIDGYFRNEELVDLAFYGISKFPFFPKSQTGWKSLKQQLPQYDLGLGVVGLAALAAVDEGNVDLGGWLLKAPSDLFRVGWYASVKKLGLQWHPRVLAGFQAAAPGFDTSLGWVEYFNPKAPSESRSIEWIVREHLLTRWAQELNWETSGIAVLRFVWLHTDPTYDKTLRGEVAFYARRPSIIEAPQVDFLIEGQLATDYRHSHAADVSVGLELPAHSVAGAVRFTSATDPVLPTEWRAGLMFGGSIGESDETDYYRRVEEVGRELREAIRQVQDVEERWCAFDARTRAASGSAPDLREAEGRLKVANDWMEAAVKRMSKRSERYARERSRLVTRIRHLQGPLTVEESEAADLLPGPVTDREARYARERASLGPICRSADPAPTLGVAE